MRRWQRLLVRACAGLAVLLAIAIAAGVLIPEGRKDEDEFRLAGLTREDLENVSIRLDESVFRHPSDFQTYARDDDRLGAATVEALLNPDGTPRERTFLVSPAEEDDGPWPPSRDTVYLSFAFVLAATGTFVLYRLRTTPGNPRP